MEPARLGCAELFQHLPLRHKLSLDVSPALRIPTGLGSNTLLQAVARSDVRIAADLDEQGFRLDGACAPTQSRSDWLCWLLTLTA